MPGREGTCLCLRSQSGSLGLINCDGLLVKIFSQLVVRTKAVDNQEGRQSFQWVNHWYRGSQKVITRANRVSESGKPCETIVSKLFPMIEYFSNSKSENR